MLIAPEQNPDWGYARNKRVALMAPSAEWVQSVFSGTWKDVDRNDFIAPNRDYPYEGLLGYHAGENWKFIDCIALGLRGPHGQSIPVEASRSRPVRATPWQSTYSYTARTLGEWREAEMPIRTSYYLCSTTTPEQLSAAFCVELPGADDLNMALVIQPVVDIRHMYSGSNVDDYRMSQTAHDQVAIEYRDRRVTFYTPPAHIQFLDPPARLGWNYKLGTGSRYEAESGTDIKETRFVPEQREVGSLFRLVIPLSPQTGTITIVITCGLAGAHEHATHLDAVAHITESKAQDLAASRRLRSAYRLRADLNTQFRQAVHGRIAGLTKLKSYVRAPGNSEYVLAAPAGAWWFRTIWYRDLFEGISNSFNTLMRLPEERDNIRKVILFALSGQDEKTGLIQSRLPEFATHEPSYNSVDATLLCFAVAIRYLRATGDKELARSVLHSALCTVTGFQENFRRGALCDGPPRLDPDTGLILCVPHHSWIDTQGRSVQYAGWVLEHLPNRASESFVKDFYDAFRDKATVESMLRSSRFFLPEINALWIRMIEGLFFLMKEFPSGHNHADGTRIDEMADLWQLARNSFKSVFWNPDKGFLFNLVDSQHLLRDDMDCEATITAAALLAHSIFTIEELQIILDRAERRLLINRTPRHGASPVPFGLLTTLQDTRVYYGDNEYHSDVVWPRSTPYLIALCRRVGRHDMVTALLENAIDHQMTEGAIFYNHEVLSKACGNNAEPIEATRHNPVPVKNPIQFWSQWCDEFLEQYEEGAGGDAGFDHSVHR